MPLKPAPPAPPPPPPLASALRAEPEACAETRARARHYGPASIDTLASLALPEGRASPAMRIRAIGLMLQAGELLPNAALNVPRSEGDPGAVGDEPEG
jgi:hypothetical protein